uniref:Uncharacterized protein n=1 Tax=Molossus molossus TaxID=27622 RepID=A0A7J8BYM0_MOLMO|nr:hypothetical protein HJG59_010092 [Molossus molossus]
MHQWSRWLRTPEQVLLTHPRPGTHGHPHLTSQAAEGEVLNTQTPSKGQVHAARSCSETSARHVCGGITDNTVSLKKATWSDKVGPALRTHLDGPRDSPGAPRPVTDAPLELSVPRASRTRTVIVRRLPVNACGMNM